ncbi:MAG TPA: hypothetical protein VFK68_00345 [Propionibacteriaceae bacterium]|nr:hypothetical protein [Propionibacteriaceae bacterium]
MSILTVAPRPLTTRPAAARKPSGPQAARPRLADRHLVAAAPVGCRVSLDAPTWQLTQRGLLVVMALLAAVLGSAVVTCLVAFLSVSNAPL